MVAEGVLGLCDADRQAGEAELGDGLKVGAGFGAKLDAVGAVDLRGDSGDFFFDALGELVGELRGAGARRFFAGGDQSAGGGERAFAAETEVVARDGVHAELGAELHDEGGFVGGVGGESVDDDDGGEAEDAGVLQVLLEIGKTAADGVGVGGGEFLEGGAALVFQGAHGGDEGEGIGPEAGGAAFEIEEFLTAEIEAEAAFGDDVVGEAEAETGGEDGVGALGDVGERAAVENGGGAFVGLDEVGHDGVLEERGHGAVDFEIAGVNGFFLAGEADEDAAEPGLQVGAG